MLPILPPNSPPNFGPFDLPSHLTHCFSQFASQHCTMAPPNSAFPNSEPVHLRILLTIPHRCTSPQSSGFVHPSNPWIYPGRCGVPDPSWIGFDLDLTPNGWMGGFGDDGFLGRNPPL